MIHFPRLVSIGLGIELVELVKFGDNKLGITVVSRLIDGGSFGGIDI